MGFSLSFRLPVFESRMIFWLQALFWRDRAPKNQRSLGHLRSPNFLLLLYNLRRRNFLYNTAWKHVFQVTASDRNIRGVVSAHAEAEEHIWSRRYTTGQSAMHRLVRPGHLGHCYVTATNKLYSFIQTYSPWVFGF